MQSISIGRNIAAWRKGLGITQGELAAYLGVSTPAVSKWESGQSYPDVALLPVLAAYFGTSVDKLLGYQPQLTTERIKELYSRLSRDFASRPFADVYADCQQYVKQYYSCWSLLFYMGILLVNHATLAGEPDQIAATYQQAKELFQRVQQFSEDPGLAKQALHMQAVTNLALNQPAEAIDLLEGSVELPLSTPVLLAKAHQMRGDRDRAKGLLQGYVYQNVVGIFGACPDLLQLYADEPEKMQAWLQAVLGMGDAFGVKEMHPAVYLPIHLLTAQLAMMRGDREQALAALEDYAGLVARLKFPLQLQGSRLFDRLQELFASFDLGSEAPRDGEVIKANARAGVLGNPVFQPLQSEARYQRLAEILKQV